MRILNSGTISRGTFIRGLAGGVAIAAVGGPFEAIQAAADETGQHDGSGVLPAPKPIPGDSAGPSGTIHVHGPGDPNVTLPFSGSLLEGLDVEPQTMTDFKGVIAQAYHVGSARGSDGMAYNLETDIRVYQGEYVAEDHSHHHGTFALL